MMRSALTAFSLVFLAVLAAPALAAARVRPVVLLHGLLADFEAMAHIEAWLRADFPGMHVHNAGIPRQNNTKGRTDSLLIAMDAQVDYLAVQLRADPLLAEGFDMVCHSQGGLTCRGYIERYNDPPAHNFISLAGPQQGVYGVPDFNDWCPDAECPWANDLMNELSMHWAEALFQSHVSFAQYWKDPLQYATYLNVSGFLADINNERPVKNAAYRANFLKLGGNLTLVKALQDHIVVPKESEWFGFFAEGSDATLQDMTATPGYAGDWIGLRTLNEAGRVERLAANCTHQDLPRAACKTVVYDAIVRPRVGGTLP